MVDRTPEEWRPALLEAAIMHVPFDGWSDQALRQAAADLGLAPEIAQLAYPGGGLELLEAHLAHADAALAEALAAAPLAEMKLRERIAFAVRTRLQQAQPHREAVARGLNMLAMPQHAALGARSLWRTVDTIWRGVGDQSTDFNYYTKRATLAAVYSATLIYWLSDHSADNADSWAFLDRRIADVMTFEKNKAAWRKTCEHLPSLTRFMGRLRYPAA